MSNVPNFFVITAFCFLALQTTHIESTSPFITNKQNWQPVLSLARDWTVLHL